MARETAAARIANLLHAELRAQGESVAKVYVLPRANGLVIKCIRDDDSVMQAQTEYATWYADFRLDEAAFVSKLAAGMPKRLSDAHWDAKGQLDLQYLFIRVLQDLGRCSQSHDDYDNLRVAGLLRLLLLDGTPLVHRVNRLHRLPIAFQVGRGLIDDVVDPAEIPPGRRPRIMKVKDGRQFHTAGNALDPEMFRGSPTELSWDDFLRTLVMKVDDHFVSLREFVLHMAHVEGIIHAGNPADDSPTDESLQKWRRMLSFPGRSPIFETLAAIGRVVYASMLPLAYECDRAIGEGRRMFSSETEPGQSDNNEQSA